MKKVLKLLLSAVLAFTLIIPLSVTSIFATPTTISGIHNAEELIATIYQFGGKATMTSDRIVHLQSPMTLENNEVFKFTEIKENIVFDINGYIISSVSTNCIFYVYNCKNNITIESTCPPLDDDAVAEDEDWDKGILTITGASGCALWINNISSDITKPGSVNVKNIKMKAGNGYAINAYGARLNMSNCSMEGKGCAINIEPTSIYKSGMSLTECVMSATDTTSGTGIITSSTATYSPSVSVKKSTISKAVYGIRGSGTISLADTRIANSKTSVYISDTTGKMSSAVTLNGYNYFTADNSSIYMDGGTLTVNNGSYSSGAGYACLRLSSLASKVVINEGTFISKNSYIINSASPNLTINGGSLQTRDSNGLYLTGGKTVINDANVYAGGYAVYNTQNLEDVVIYKGCYNSDNFVYNTTIHSNSEVKQSTESSGNKPTMLVRPKVKSISLSYTTATYSGSAKKPTVKVVDANGKTLELGDDYTVKYSNNTYVGKAAVKVMPGDGAYEGYDGLSKTLYFTIKPKATSLKSVTAKSKGFAVSWAQITSQVSGYQVQYSTTSGFTSDNHTRTITSYKTTSTTFTGLKAKKKYYVRVRVYKTVSGTKYYSSYSSKKYVTTKA